MHNPLPGARPRAEEAAVLAALDADGLTTARLTEALEEELAIWTGGVSCVAVSTAGAALLVAWAACGVRRGDEVVVSPLTGAAAASAAVLLGATPVFADVDDATGNLDPAAVADALTARTRAVVAGDHAGHPSDYDELRAAIVAAGTALLLADSGGAIGATYQGVPVGGLADLTALSFEALGLGGGVVAVADESLLTAVRRARSLGTDGGSDVYSLGLDCAPPAVHCALARVRLRGLSRVRARRTDLADRYAKLLDGVAGLRLPTRREWVEPAWHRYPVRVLDGRRARVEDALLAAGVDVERGPIPLYRQPAFAALGYEHGVCPTAERIAGELILLPLAPDLTDADQDAVVDGLRAALA